MFHLLEAHLNIQVICIAIETNYGINPSRANDWDLDRKAGNTNTLVHSRLNIHQIVINMPNCR